MMSGKLSAAMQQYQQIQSFPVTTPHGNGGGGSSATPHHTSLLQTFRRASGGSDSSAAAAPETVAVPSEDDNRLLHQLRRASVSVPAQPPPPAPAAPAPIATGAGSPRNQSTHSRRASLAVTAGGNSGDPTSPRIGSGTLSSLPGAPVSGGGGGRSRRASMTIAHPPPQHLEHQTGPGGATVVGGGGAIIPRLRLSIAGGGGPAGAAHHAPYTTTNANTSNAIAAAAASAPHTYSANNTPRNVPASLVAPQPAPTSGGGTTPHRGSFLKTPRAARGVRGLSMSGSVLSVGAAGAATNPGASSASVISGVPVPASPAQLRSRSRLAAIRQRLAKEETGADADEDSSADSEEDDDAVDAAANAQRANQPHYLTSTFATKAKRGSGAKHERMMDRRALARRVKVKHKTLTLSAAQDTIGPINPLTGKAWTSAERVAATAAAADAAAKAAAARAHAAVESFFGPDGLGSTNVALPSMMIVQKPPKDDLDKQREKWIQSLREQKKLESENEDRSRSGSSLYRMSSPDEALWSKWRREQRLAANDLDAPTAAAPGASGSATARPATSTLTATTLPSGSVTARKLSLSDERASKPASSGASRGVVLNDEYFAAAIRSGKEKILPDSDEEEETEREKLAAAEAAAAALNEEKESKHVDPNEALQQWQVNLAIDQNLQLWVAETERAAAEQHMNDARMQRAAAHCKRIEAQKQPPGGIESFTVRQSRKLALAGYGDDRLGGSATDDQHHQMHGGGKLHHHHNSHAHPHSHSHGTGTGSAATASGTNTSVAVSASSPRRQVLSHTGDHAHVTASFTPRMHSHQLQKVEANANAVATSTRSVKAGGVSFSFPASEVAAATAVPATPHLPYLGGSSTAAAHAAAAMEDDEFDPDEYAEELKRRELFEADEVVNRTADEARLAQRIEQQQRITDSTTKSDSAESTSTLTAAERRQRRMEALRDATDDRNRNDAQLRAELMRTVDRILGHRKPGLLEPNFIPTLVRLRRKWLAISEDVGLTIKDFTRFITKGLSLHGTLTPEEAGVLFQKVDVNSDKTVSWSEYLDYLLREYSHTYMFSTADGTWHIRPTDQLPAHVSSPVVQILVIPSFLNRHPDPIYALMCRDNSIQLWDSQTLTQFDPTPEANGDPGDPCSELDMKREGRTHGGTFGQYYNENDWKRREKQRKELLDKQTKLDTRVKRSTRTDPYGHWAGTEYYIDSLQGPKLAAARRFTQNGEPDHWQLEAQTERLYPRSTLTRRRDEQTAPLSSRSRFHSLNAEYTKWTRNLGHTKHADVNKDPNFTDPPEWELLTRVRRDKFYPNTAMAYWERERQVVVACTDKTLSFFSLTPKKVWCSSVFSVFETPQCLTVTPAGYSNRDCVVFGDTAGNLQLYDALKQDLIQRVPIHGAQVVRKVAFIPRLGLVSAGMDGRIAIFDEEKSSVRYLGAGKFSEIADETQWCGHKLGAYTFAHCPSHRVLLSAGYDNKVMIWDPIRIDHATSVLPISALKKPSAHTHTVSMAQSLANWRAPAAPSCTRPHRHDLVSSHSHIVDIVVNEDNNQIITACSDKKINIYDIRMLRCIYETIDTTDHGGSHRAGGRPAGPTGATGDPLTTNPDGSENTTAAPSTTHAPIQDELTAIVFDEYQRRLVTAGSQLRVWPVQVAPGNRSQEGVSTSENDAVIATLYSSAFQWIVTVTMNGNVRIWDAKTTESKFSFEASAPGNPVGHTSEITAAALDLNTVRALCGKRLLTGSHDGRIIMWGINAGDHVNRYPLLPTKKEITGLLYLDRTAHPLVGLSFDPYVFRWMDHQQKDKDKRTRAVGTDKKEKAPLGDPFVHMEEELNPPFRYPYGNGNGGSSDAGSGPVFDGLTQRRGHLKEVTAMAYAQSKSMLFTGGSDGRLISWHVDSCMESKWLDIDPIERRAPPPAAAAHGGSAPVAPGSHIQRIPRTITKLLFIPIVEPKADGIDLTVRRPSTGAAFHAANSGASGEPDSAAATPLARSSAAPIKFKKRESSNNLTADNSGRTASVTASGAGSDVVTLSVSLDPNPNRAALQEEKLNAYQRALAGAKRNVAATGAPTPGSPPPPSAAGIPPALGQTSGPGSGLNLLGATSGGAGSVPGTPAAKHRHASLKPGDTSGGAAAAAAAAAAKAVSAEEQEQKRLERIQYYLLVGTDDGALFLVDPYEHRILARFFNVMKPVDTSLKALLAANAQANADAAAAKAVAAADAAAAAAATTPTAPSATAAGDSTTPAIATITITPPSDGTGAAPAATTAVDSKSASTALVPATTAAAAASATAAAAVRVANWVPEPILGLAIDDPPTRLMVCDRYHAKIFDWQPDTFIAQEQTTLVAAEASIAAKADARGGRHHHRTARKQKLAAAAAAAVGGGIGASDANRVLSGALALAANAIRPRWEVAGHSQSWEPHPTPMTEESRRKITDVIYIPSPSADAFMTSSSRGEVTLWTKNGVFHSRLGSPTLLALCYSPKLCIVVAVSSDEKIRVWDPTNGQNTHSWEAGHSSRLTAACLDPSLQYLITASRNGKVKMHALPTGELTYEFPQLTFHGQIVEAPLHSLLFMHRTNQQMPIPYPLIGLTHGMTLSGGAGTGADAAASATAAGNDSIQHHLFRWASRDSKQDTKFTTTETTHSRDVTCAAAHGFTLVTGSMDGSVIIWNMEREEASPQRSIPITTRQLNKLLLVAYTERVYMDNPTPAASRRADATAAAGAKSHRPLFDEKLFNAKATLVAAAAAAAAVPHSTMRRASGGASISVTEPIPGVTGAGPTAVSVAPLTAPSATSLGGLGNTTTKPDKPKPPTGPPPEEAAALSIVAAKRKFVTALKLKKKNRPPTHTPSESGDMSKLIEDADAAADDDSDDGKHAHFPVGYEYDFDDEQAARRGAGARGGAGDPAKQTLLYVGSDDGMVHILTPWDGVILRRIQCLDEGIVGMAVDDKRTRLMVCGRHRARVWNISAAQSVGWKGEGIYPIGNGPFVPHPGHNTTDLIYLYPKRDRSNDPHFDASGDTSAATGSHKRGRKGKSGKAGSGGTDGKSVAPGSPSKRKSGGAIKSSAAAAAAAASSAAASNTPASSAVDALAYFMTCSNHGDMALWTPNGEDTKIRFTTAPALAQQKLSNAAGGGKKRRFGRGDQKDFSHLDSGLVPHASAAAAAAKAASAELALYTSAYDEAHLFPPQYYSRDHKPVKQALSLAKDRVVRGLGALNEELDDFVSRVGLPSLAERVEIARELARSKKQFPVLPPFKELVVPKYYQSNTHSRFAAPANSQSVAIAAAMDPELPAFGNGVTAAAAALAATAAGTHFRVRPPSSQAAARNNGRSRTGGRQSPPRAAATVAAAAAAEAESLERVFSGLEHRALPPPPVALGIQKRPLTSDQTS